MASRVFQSNFTWSKILELWRDTSALKGAFEVGDLPTVATKLQATLHLPENARLDTGITGGTGSGKSTFVNAIRGLGDEDPRSAYTGVVEMSVDPTPYAHPKYPNVVIWDLLGIDTPTFQAKKYLQQVLLDRYDFLLLITLESFTAHHTQLACEILQQGKRFYFIRFKVDVDMRPHAAGAPAPFQRKEHSARPGRTVGNGWKVSLGSGRWKRVGALGVVDSGGMARPFPFLFQLRPTVGKGSSKVTLRD